MDYFEESRYNSKHYAAATSGTSVFTSLQHIYSVTKELLSKLDELSLELLKSSNTQTSCQNCKTQQKRCHTLKVLLAKKQFSMNQLENKLKNLLKRKRFRLQNSTLAKTQHRKEVGNVCSETVGSLKLSDKRKVLKTKYSAAEGQWLQENDSFCLEDDRDKCFDDPDMCAIDSALDSHSGDNSQESIVYSQENMDQSCYTYFFDQGAAGNASEKNSDTATVESPLDNDAKITDGNNEDSTNPLTSPHTDCDNRYFPIEQQNKLKRKNKVITPVKSFHKQAVYTSSGSKPQLKSSFDVQRSLQKTVLCCTDIVVSGKESDSPALPLAKVTCTSAKIAMDKNLFSGVKNMSAMSHSQSAVNDDHDNGLNQPENRTGKISTDQDSLPKNVSVSYSPVEMEEYIEAVDVIVIDDDEDDIRNMPSPDSSPPSPSLLTTVQSESDLSFLDTLADTGKCLKVTNKTDSTTTTNKSLTGQGSNAKIQSRSCESQLQKNQTISSSGRVCLRKTKKQQIEDYTKPPTPEGFWDIGLSDSDSEKRKAKDDGGAVRLPRLRKPYVKKFNSLTEDLEKKKTDAKKKKTDDEERKTLN